MLSLRAWPILFVFVSMIGMGCTQKVQTHPGDAATVEKVERFQPKIVINGRGRVIELVLEGPKVQDEELAAVKELTELRQLSLYGASITDRGLEDLKGLVRLESLGLGKTKITDKGVSILQHFPNLRWVWLSELPDVTPSSIDKLKAASPRLKVYTK